ncbi:MAG: hypothetical protein F9K16_12595 [Thermoanaerobaculia bacterium]|nr:MAG: hypothetical protein F9K16_12595 [Thermoanaerobaculia bacterium]MBZ0102835.1 hypothetical protein [Thermoanaerobaculia bacterium]
MPGASAGKTGSHLPPYEQFILLRVVSGVCERASAITATFSGWLLAGFGGAVALILSNESALVDRLPKARVDCIFVLFAASSIAAFVAKWHAVFIARVVGAIKAVLEVLDAHEKEARELDVDLPLPPVQLFGSLMLEAVPRPARYFVKMIVDKDAGDTLASARKCARRTFWQSALTTLQVGLFAAAVAVVIWPSG